MYEICIESAFETQSSWPGRLPWGGIYPGARKAWAALPKGERLWSLHVHAYCMSPHCRLESYQSYRLGADWEKVFFGTESESRIALQGAGLNFFLISTELSVADPFALRPDEIAKHFGIFWTDGTTALLTWKSGRTAAISPEGLEGYRKQVIQSRLGEAYPYRPLETVLHDLRQTGDYSRLRTLRWDRGLDGMLSPPSTERSR